MAKGLQNLFLKGFVNHLKQFPTIGSLYVRGSTAEGTYLFGVSDIDVLAILKPQSPQQDFEFINNPQVNRFSKFFPFAKLYAFSSLEAEVFNKISKTWLVNYPTNCTLVFSQPNSLQFIFPQPKKVGLRLTYWLALNSRYAKSNSNPSFRMRNFYKMTYKLCRNLIQINFHRQCKNIFDVDFTCCLKETRDPFLKEIIRKSASKNILDFYSRNPRLEMKEILDRLQAWKDELNFEDDTESWQLEVIENIWKIKKTLQENIGNNENFKQLYYEHHRQLTCLLPKL